MVTGFYLGSNLRIEVDNETGLPEKKGAVHIDLSSYMLPSDPLPELPDEDPSIFSSDEMRFDLPESSSFSQWKRERVDSIETSRTQSYDDSVPYGFIQEESRLEERIKEPIMRVLYPTSPLYQSYRPVSSQGRYYFPQRDLTSSFYYRR